MDDAKSFVDSVKDLRREGALSGQVNVYYDSEAEEVHVSADEGRARRPLIVVKGGRPLLSEKQVQQLTNGEITWHDLIRQGVVEYLDAGEEENGKF